MFCIVTDMPAVATAVDNTRCNHPGVPHSPHQLLGSSRTKSAAEWPHELDMMILDAIQQQNLVDEETIYNVFAYPAGMDDEPEQEDHPDNAAQRAQHLVKSTQLLGPRSLFGSKLGLSGGEVCCGRELAVVPQ